MRRLALLLVVLALPAAAQGRFDRTNSRTPQGRSTRGFAGDSGPFFEFAPFSGAGMTAECACTAVAGSKGEAVTVTRGSSAWCTKADYSLVSCGNNLPRVMTGGGSAIPLGLFIEDTATNSLTQNRDLSQAVWTKTSMTCAKTATGTDGVTNSASTCTASAANGTALQALVIAAATRNSSLYIKRRTGTGVVEVTRDNGATWTAITSSLSAGVFKRVVSTEAVGCAFGNCIIVPAMTSGVANPTVGIRVVASGDAVDVDLVQDEPNAFPSSPVTTTAAAAARSAETMTAPYANTIGCMGYSVLKTGFTGAYANGADARTGGANFFSSYVDENTPDNGGAAYCYAYTGAGTAVGNTVFVPPLGPTPIRCSHVASTTMTTSTIGTVYSFATSAGSVAGLTTLTLGGGISALNGVLSNVMVDPDSSKCTGGRTHPTAIAWVGDSITRGDNAAPSRPPAVLRTLLPGRTVYNLGVNGQSAATCRAIAAGAVAARAGTLVMLCGVNSLLTLSPAATWADLEAALNDAKAAGLTVIPVKLTPWATAATWSAGLQTATDTLNTYIQAWCTANGATCVDTSSLGSGSPLVLLPGYDSGDHLHLNAAGGAALAALVQAANP